MAKLPSEKTNTGAVDVEAKTGKEIASEFGTCSKGLA